MTARPVRLPGRLQRIGETEEATWLFPNLVSRPARPVPH
jgi:hypothetical protein